MTLEGFDGFVDAQLAHVDALVGGAGREAVVVLPVDVERRRRVEGELLRAVPRTRVPDDCRLQCKVQRFAHFSLRWKSRAIHNSVMFPLSKATLFTQDTCTGAPQQHPSVSMMEMQVTDTFSKLTTPPPNHTPHQTMAG